MKRKEHVLDWGSPAIFPNRTSEQSSHSSELYPTKGSEERKTVLRQPWSANAWASRQCTVFLGCSEMWACPNGRGPLCWQVIHSLAATHPRFRPECGKKPTASVSPAQGRGGLSPQSGPHCPAHLLACFSPGAARAGLVSTVCQGGQRTPYWPLRTSREALGLGAAYFSWISQLAVKTQMEKATRGWGREVKLKDERRNTKTASSQGSLCWNPDITETISRSCFHRILPTSLATRNVSVKHHRRLMHNTCKGD